MSNEKAKVKAQASMTVNMGNYESAKVEAGIELPVEATKQGVESGFKNAWAEVYRQLEIKIAEIRGQAK